MNDADGKARAEAEPQIGRDRRRRTAQATGELHLDGDPGRDLVGREHEVVSARQHRVRARDRRACEHGQPDRITHARTLTRGLVLAITAAAGCTGDLADNDAAFYNWDGRTVHCTVEGDSNVGNDIESIERGLDRAKERGEVLELLVHAPGESLPWDDFERLLSAVEDRGLAWVTYEDIANGIPATGGISLQYDGGHMRSWTASREYLQRHHARVTIFVTRYAGFSDDDRAQLRALADDGNDIEAHAVNHLRGPVVVEEEGLEWYLDNEVQPSIDILRDDGYSVVSFAYPFGDRTDEIDEAVSKRVQLVRSLTIVKPLVTSPCPY